MRYPLVPKSRLTTLVLFVGIAFLQVGANEAQAQSRVGVKNYDDQGRFVAASDDQALSPRYIDHGLAKKLVAEPAAVSEPVAEPVEADLYGEHTDGVLASAPSTTTSSGLCGTSENRVGFNGYRYDCELGLYYTPSGRTYDPKIGRFIQQDSYLGDILNPPSLHRYTYGHNNPTSFVDPTGHESYRQWIGLDKPTPSFWHEFGKNIAYRSFNFVSLGTLGRQDRLVEQFEAGKIADEQYGRRTAINAGTGAVVLGAAVVTGGAAAGATGVVASAGGLTAAEVTLASGVSAGGFGALGAQTANDLMELHGTRTKEVGDIQTSDYVAAFGLGAATGPLASGVGNPSLPSFRGLDNPVTSGLVGTIEAAGQYAYEGGANAARALIVVEGGSGPVLAPATSDLSARSSASEGALDWFTEAQTPWRRRVYQRPDLDIDWDFVRPEGTSLSGKTNWEAATQGYAPGRVNPATGKWDDIVLHHANQDPRGAVIETWRSTHARVPHQMDPPGPWRQSNPEWAQAWQREQAAYWRWRTGEYNPPPTDRLRLPGDR